MRRVLPAILAVTLALAVSACGDDSDTIVEGPPADATTAAQSTTGEVPEDFGEDATSRGPSEPGGPQGEREAEAREEALRSERERPLRRRYCREGRGRPLARLLRQANVAFKAEDLPRLRRASNRIMQVSRSAPIGASCAAVSLGVVLRHWQRSEPAAGIDPDVEARRVAAFRRRHRLVVPDGF